MMLAIWRWLLRRESYADRWLANQFLSERHVQRIAQEAEQVER